jgi:hypothetical protein
VRRSPIKPERSLLSQPISAAVKGTRTMQEELAAVEQFLREREERRAALLHEVAEIMEEAFNVP